MNREDIRQYGKQLDPKKYKWDEQGRIFMSDERDLVLAFGYIDNLNIVCGDNSTIYAGNGSQIYVCDYCTVFAGDNCKAIGVNENSFIFAKNANIKARDNCSFRVGEGSNIDAGKSSNIVTGGDNCKFIVCEPFTLDTERYTFELTLKA